MAFRNGALRITRTPGRLGAKNCVNLGDIIQKDQLVSACIYAFYISRDELFRHLPISGNSARVPVSNTCLSRPPGIPKTEADWIADIHWSRLKSSVGRVG